MKHLPWILIAVLSLCLIASLFIDRGKTETVEKRDTITRIDTIKDTVLNTVFVKFDHWDTAYFPIIFDNENADTIVNNDSVKIAVPIEKKEYKTDYYRAVISGYKPNLDLMEVYSKTQTITITPKKKRWGLGLQAGYGYPGGWYIGAGISYNIISW